VAGEAWIDGLSRTLARGTARRTLLKLIGVAAGRTWFKRVIGTGSIGIVLSSSPLTSPALIEAKPSRSCSKKALSRCARPAVKKLRAAVKRCETTCSNRGPAACDTCMDPEIRELAAVAEACLEKHCGIVLDPKEQLSRPPSHRGPTAGTAEGRAGTYPSGTCSNNALTNCHKLAFSVDFLLRCTSPSERCFKSGNIFIGILRCGIALIGCTSYLWEKILDCNIAHGCIGKGFCINDRCCPNQDDVVCGEVCCRPSRCESCVNGV
jgi:hypothetical protein